MIRLHAEEREPLTGPRLIKEYLIRYPAYTIMPDPACWVVCEGRRVPRHERDTWAASRRYGNLNTKPVFAGEETMKKGTVDPEVLEEIIRRIVACANPEKIVLFGSGARGEMGPASDIDLLVIKSGEFDAGSLTEEIYMNLIGIGQAVDIIVISSLDVERFRNSPYFIVYPALQQGREVYHAGEVST